MALVSEQLLATLDNLNTERFRRFKWHLKNLKGFPIAALDEADALDTVDKMVDCFGPEEAVKIMVDILRKMNQNHLAEHLEKKHKQAQAEGSNEDPVLAGVCSKPIRGMGSQLKTCPDPTVLLPSLAGLGINKSGESGWRSDAGELSVNRVADPETRSDFLQYSHQLTLDLNTVNRFLRLFEGNRAITNTLPEQPYPDHPDRFEYFNQVLCSKSVCGRGYWEIEWSGEMFGVSVSVSYKSIRRKGRVSECWFGCNDQSWSLICSSDRHSFKHNYVETALPVKPISRRVGVYVDHSAGILSFYSVSDTMSLIHTVQTTFTQPLYPGFWIGSGSSVKLCW